MFSIGNLNIGYMVELRRCNHWIPDPPRHMKEEVDLEQRADVNSSEVFEDLNC